MLLDVVGALKVVDYVNSLFECENHGLSERELVLKRLIENAPLVRDERFGGYEFNSVVHGFVADRFLVYQRPVWCRPMWKVFINIVQR